MGLTTSPIPDPSELSVSLLNVLKRVNLSPPQLFDFYSNNILFCVGKQNISLNSLMGQDSSNQRLAFDSRIIFHFSGFFSIQHFTRQHLVCVLARAAYDRENKQFKFHLSKNDREIIQVSARSGLGWGISIWSWAVRWRGGWQLVTSEGSEVITCCRPHNTDCCSSYLSLMHYWEYAIIFTQG